MSFYLKQGTCKASFELDTIISIPHEALNIILILFFVSIFGIEIDKKKNATIEIMSTPLLS